MSNTIMTEKNNENANIVRLRREGIETKVATEHREVETKTSHASQALPSSNTKLFNVTI